MKAIVSLASNRGNYYQGLARLGDSLKGRFDGHFFGFMGEHCVGAPRHLDNPYAFKIFAIDYVRMLGFKKILWLDSSVYAVADVEPAFALMEINGYMMQEAGQWVGRWCNDFTLAYFGITREEAMAIPCYGNAGMLGLDFNTPVAQSFFADWRKSMKAGCFKGSWDDHRHDLTCGSIIAHRRGMRYQPGDQILQYAAPEDPLQNETIILKAQGC